MAFPKPFYRWRPHPWHGLEPGDRAPEIVEAYIEITPYDLVKFETDKRTGYLRVDRPQRTTSTPPALYGFIPRTFCGDRVGRLTPEAGKGDGDPLDICVISERPINHGDIVVAARVVGVLKAIDHGEADDKIVAVLEKDNIWAGIDDVSGLPGVLLERLAHYFSTYKLRPGETPGRASLLQVAGIEGREHALEVIRAALADYADEFGD